MEIPAYSSEYSTYCSLDEYKRGIEYVTTELSELEGFYESVMFVPLNDALTAASAMDQATAESILESKRDKLKKDYAAKLLSSGMLVKFLDLWIGKVQAEIETQKTAPNWSATLTPVPLDFVRIENLDKFARTNFSAIR